MQSGIDISPLRLPKAKHKPNTVGGEVAATFRENLALADGNLAPADNVKLGKLITLQNVSDFGDDYPSPGAQFSALWRFVRDKKL